MCSQQQVSGEVASSVVSLFLLLLMHLNRLHMLIACGQVTRLQCKRFPDMNDPGLVIFTHLFFISSTATCIM